MKKYMVAASAVDALAASVEATMQLQNLKEAWLNEVRAEGGCKVQLDTDHDWPLRCAAWLLSRGPA